MYALQVFYPGNDGPPRVEIVERARDAMARIPELLKEHHGCEKIVVCYESKPLFVVDCAGNTTPA